MIFKRHRIADFSVWISWNYSYWWPKSVFTIEPNVDLNATVQDYFEPTTGMLN
jgi:hypothetical protein